MAGAATGHRIRIVLLVVSVAAPLLVGWNLRPHVQEAPDLVGPSIVVLASQSGVSATVTAALTVSTARGRHPSTLRLTIVPTSTFSGTLELTVGLYDFPFGTTVAGATIVPVTPPKLGSALAALPVAAAPHPRGYSDYAVPATLSAAGSSSESVATLTIRAPRPIGEHSLGAQLRVAFPVLRGEGPGAGPPGGYLVKDLFPAAAAAAGVRHEYPMALQAGTSTFSDQAVSLTGYQILAGDPPTLQGATRWAWAGVNDATVLAANLHTQDVEQLKVFWSGLAIGLALAAFITLLLEVIPAEADAGSADGAGSREARASDGAGSREARASDGAGSSEGRARDSAAADDSGPPDSTQPDPPDATQPDPPDATQPGAG